MGWLWFAGSFKIYVSFAEYSLFYRTLLQKRPRCLGSLLVVASSYLKIRDYSHCVRHTYVTWLIRVCVCVCLCVYVYVCETIATSRMNESQHTHVSHDYVNQSYEWVTAHTQIESLTWLIWVCVHVCMCSLLQMMQMSHTTYINKSHHIHQIRNYSRCVRHTYMTWLIQNVLRMSHTTHMNYWEWPLRETWLISYVLRHDSFVMCVV